MAKIGFIGFGSMASLIATKIIETEVATPEEIILYSNSKTSISTNFILNIQQLS